MITFKRYPHINDLLSHYANTLGNAQAQRILTTQIEDEKDAVCFSNFIWQVVDNVHQDQESGVEVMGAIDNTEMLPDLAYEISCHMQKVGFYSIWERISEAN